MRITGTKSECGSTMAMLTDSISGIIPTRSSQRTAPKWDPSTRNGSSPQRAAQIRESSPSNLSGSPDLVKRSWITTRYVFSKVGGARVIDQITTLRALTHVVFHDDKEGLFGMRISGWLESPMEKGGIFSEASGRPTRVSGASSPGASGVYLTSEGRRGDKA